MKNETLMDLARRLEGNGPRSKRGRWAERLAKADGDENRIYLVAVEIDMDSGPQTTDETVKVARRLRSEISRARAERLRSNPGLTKRLDAIHTAARTEMLAKRHEYRLAVETHGADSAEAIESYLASVVAETAETTAFTTMRALLEGSVAPQA